MYVLTSLEFYVVTDAGQAISRPVSVCHTRSIGTHAVHFQFVSRWRSGCVMGAAVVGDVGD
jgi:hypothetical protein